MATELTEAVLSASGAAALIQKQIDPVVQELQRRYAPLVRVLPSIRWGSTIYNFNQRSQVAAGGFVTDGGARPISTSTYTQYPFTIKNLQAVGGVTGYAEAVTADLIGSLRAKEIEGAARGLEWDVETGLDWGNAASTLNGPYPQYDGLDTLVSDATSSAPNTINWSGSLGPSGNTGILDLTIFDNLIEMVESNAATYPDGGTDYFFLVSSGVNSRVAQLLTNQQRFNAADSGAITNTEVAAGLIVPTYRNIPFIKSSFLNPRSNAMTTVTITTATTSSDTPALSAGTLPNTTTYKYVVSAVIARFGEILASNEVSQLTGSGANIITLAWATPPSVTQLGQTLSPILYKVWRTAANGSTKTETLLGYVDANVGLQSDGITPLPTTSIVDTGTALVPQNGSTIPATTPAAYVGTNAGMVPPTTGAQNIYLLPRDPDFIIRPYVREMQTVDVYPTTSSPDSLPFAFVCDTCLATRAPQFMARATNAVATLAV
jgi:hypothetical protein